jgi:hypothetical protein
LHRPHKEIVSKFLIRRALNNNSNNNNNSCSYNKSKNNISINV